MKFKITWPNAIIISLSAFIIFILSFVYKVTFMQQYDHHLVSEDYYKDELNYQKEIDDEKKGINLKENISLKRIADGGMLITFPAEFNPTEITGTVSFMRLSNKKIDFNFPIKLKTSELFLKDENLVAGRWDVKIEWTVKNSTYLFKQKIIY